MNKRALLSNLGRLMLVLALFWSLISLRALPAIFRGSYTTEGGEWLSLMWRIGFLKSIAVIRPDYCVFGNLVVLQLSEWANWLLHGANVDHAPMIQHHLSTGYVAAMFTVVFSLLRRHHNTWGSLIVCLAMLLVPDLDDENRIFGEATNLGYFSALVVLFVFYDLWLSASCSVRRLVGYGLLVAFHIATSPMAGIIAVAWSGLLGLRLFLDKSGVAGLPLRRWVAFLLPLIVFSLFTIIRAQKCGPTAAPTDMNVFKSSFVEIVLARQLLYPLITNVFIGFSDRLTVMCFALLLAFTGWFVLSEWKSQKKDWQRLTAILVVFGAAVGMSLATAYTRQWIYSHEAHYASLWPARYYIVQNMVATAFLALMLLRLCELKPGLKTAALVFAGVMGTNFAMQQMQKTGRYLAQDDPHIVARYWPYQFRREHAIQTLVGDNAEAVKQTAANSLHTIEININDHFMQMSVDQMEEAVATPLRLKSDATPVAFVEAGSMKAEDREYSQAFHSENFRIIPRAGGALVSFDLRLDGLPLFDIKRRRLWLGKVPGEVQAVAFGYEMPKGERSISEMRRERKPQNRLFKVYLYFKGPWTLDGLRQTFAGLPCAIGEAPDKYLATTAVLLPGDRPCLSAMTGDTAFALRLHPHKLLFDWDGDLKKVKLLNCTQSKGGQISLKAAKADDFDEAAYLQNNPDIAEALARKAVTSGKAYFETLGRDETRQICHYSVTLPVSEPVTMNQVDGVWVQLNRGQGARPPTLTCELHGEAGEATTMRLRPAEGETQYATYFLPNDMASKPHGVRSLELQFEGVGQDNRAFTIDEVKLYGH